MSYSDKQRQAAIMPSPLATCSHRCICEPAAIGQHTDRKSVQVDIAAAEQVSDAIRIVDFRPSRRTHRCG